MGNFFLIRWFYKKLNIKVLKNSIWCILYSFMVCFLIYWIVIVYLFWVIYFDNKWLNFFIFFLLLCYDVM